MNDLIYVNSSDLSKGVRLYSSENFTPSLLPCGIMPAHPTFFVKREIYKKYGIFKENYKILADFELIVRFLFVNRISYYYMKGVTVKMRMGGVSASLKSLVTNNIEMVEACRENGHHHGMGYYLDSFNSPKDSKDNLPLQDLFKVIMSHFSIHGDIHKSHN